MSFDELKSRIVALNNTKNEYATKKLKNDISESDEKDMISSLIYVIAEVKRCASDIGISDDGKVNRTDQDIEQFSQLNESVKNLKTQILFLVSSSPDFIRSEMSKQNDIKKQSEKKESDSSSGRNETEDTKNRLRQRLQNSSTKE